MAKYIQDLSYSMHSVLRVTHQLKVIEEPVIPSNQSKLTISIVRNNSGSEADGGYEHLLLKINGSTVYDRTDTHTFNIPAYGSDEVFTQTHYVSHNSSCGGNFTVSVEYKCDYIEGFGAFSQYWTYASAEMTQALTPIDQSAPTISDLSVSANRYGAEASASFIAGHKSYPLTKIQFTLSGLTRKQAQACTAANAGADSLTSSSANDVYSIVLTKEKNLLNPSDITFAINATLDSGGQYGYSVTVNAQNGKSKTETGILAVPQKVTGISCEETIDLKQGTTENLEYTVIPSNAELTSVIFNSSDITVATVNENGLITAVSDGITIITVTSVDGDFSASCTVSVFNTDIFPQLSELRILTAKDISKLSSACNFLRGKMIESGTDVPVLVSVNCTGRNHPVAEIRSLLEAIESNCQTLKASAASAGFSTDSLTEPQNITKKNINWYVAVNEWIVFLNELNSKLP